MYKVPFSVLFRFFLGEEDFSGSSKSQAKKARDDEKLFTKQFLKERPFIDGRSSPALANARSDT